MADFRSERSPSPEGQGEARGRWQKAWKAYESAVQKHLTPVIEPAIRPVAVWIAGRWTEELVGFWMLWQLEGGFEGLQRLGMSRSATYRRVSMFRKVFGEHPDTFRFPGVEIKVDEYLRHQGPLIGDRDSHPLKKTPAGVS